jgi:hypothetical protein
VAEDDLAMPPLPGATRLAAAEALLDAFDRDLLEQLDVPIAGPPGGE